VPAGQRKALREVVTGLKLYAMLKVGLTGGIASGKTTILGMFSALGAHTLRADAVAHQLMAPGSPCMSGSLPPFGERNSCAGWNDYAREVLRQLSRPHRELNAIVHRQVKTYEDDLVCPRWANVIQTR